MTSSRLPFEKFPEPSFEQISSRNYRKPCNPLGDGCPPTSTLSAETTVTHFFPQISRITETHNKYISVLHTGTTDLFSNKKLYFIQFNGFGESSMNRNHIAAIATSVVTFMSLV